MAVQETVLPSAVKTGASRVTTELEDEDELLDAEEVFEDDAEDVFDDVAEDELELAGADDELELAAVLPQDAKMRGRAKTKRLTAIVFLFMFFPFIMNSEEARISNNSIY